MITIDTTMISTQYRLGNEILKSSSNSNNNNNNKLVSGFVT